MIWLIVGVGVLASLFGGAYFHDEIYIPYSHHLERSQKFFNDQKWQYANPVTQYFFWDYTGNDTPTIHLPKDMIADAIINQ